MNIICLGLMTIMLSLFSSLMGCKSKADTAPDFNETITKVIYFDSGFQLAYEIPSNMSNLMNFAERYSKESSRTHSVSVSSGDDFKLEQWRMSKKIDGALWDYRGDKKKGIAGDIGDLNFQITLDKLEKSDDLERFVLNAYDNFLNGSKGLNTDVRKSEMGERQSDEELGDWIINTPKSTQSVVIGGRDFKNFSVAWRGGEFYTYFVTPINEKRFLTLMFRYTVRANSKADFDVQEIRVTDDIQKIINRLVFK